MFITFSLLFLALLAAAGLWYWQKVFFYRDPVRHAPGDSRKVVAACDGKVMYCYRVQDGQVVANKLGKPIPVTEIFKMDLPQPVTGTLIGVYMSPKDVHFNYAPVAATIQAIHVTRARLNLPMVDLWEYLNFVWLNNWVNLFGNRYHFENERVTLLLKGSPLSVVMVEIADIFVNKVSLFVKEGDFLPQGTKVSFIERGSQVDLLILGDNHRVLVQPGIHVTGGETVLAEAT